MGNAAVVVVVLLHEIARRTRNEIGDFLHIVGGVELFDYSRAELVVHSALFQKAHAFEDFAHIHVVDANRARILFGAVFDIHCNEIYKFFVQNLFEHVGAKSVGVELRCIAHISHLCQKVA